MTTFDTRLRAYAKINLSLAILARRADGFHDIRTVFQTISLADTLAVSWQPGRRTAVEVTSDVEIPGENICTRAAHLVLAAAGRTGSVRIHIGKRIPMGGGLGGGSTDAAAVLMALRHLIGKPRELAPLAAELGSDVPFFLHGGCALGAGRGEELYPLPDPGKLEGVLLTPPIHVSTKDAYGGLGRPLAADLPIGHRFPARDRIQSLAWSLDARRPAREWAADCVNDFEATVFALNSRLAALRKKLDRAGASIARMTGSGAALFGLWTSPEEADSAHASLRSGQGGAQRFRLIRRAQYQRQWSRWLAPSP
jgi:4-diphosphocytidyl-2-C-methyl-D-erythritol kinase